MDILLIILLLEGFITISVEILTIRQLTPFFGSSVVITSIIIGIFLLFLALGYSHGGLYKEDCLQKLRRNFMLSLFWIGIGLSYAFLWYFFKTTLYVWHFPALASLILYLLLVLAPTVYWLGQTIPLTTNLFNQEQKVSQISGHALFLSTVGSFLGALVTTLILFQYAGIAWTVVVNCLLLWLLIARIPHPNKLPVGLLLIALCSIKMLNVDFEKNTFVLTNNYGNYQVQAQADNSRTLFMNLSASSQLSHQNTGFPYIEFIKNFLFKEMKLENKQLLVIGAGGFSLSAAGVGNNIVTYVDIDKDIKEVSEKYFLQKPIQGEFHSDDARLFFNKFPEKIYDVIISDAYSHTNSIPQSLLTQEYFRQIYNHLAPSGILIANIIADPLFRNTYSRRVHNTIGSLFNHCTVTPIGWSQSSNMLYVCTKQHEDRMVYTDNASSATLDFFNATR